MANTSGYVQAALAGADANYLNRDQLGSSIRNLGSVLGERRVRKEDAAERQLIRDTEAENLAMDRKREKEIADLADKYNAFGSLMEIQQQAEEARQFGVKVQTDKDQNIWQAGQNDLDRALSNKLGEMGVGTPEQQESISDWFIEKFFPVSNPYDVTDPETRKVTPGYMDSESQKLIEEQMIAFMKADNLDDTEILLVNGLMESYFQGQMPNIVEDDDDGDGDGNTPRSLTDVHIPSTREATEIGNELFQLEGNELLDAFNLIEPKFLNSDDPEIIKQGVELTNVKNEAQVNDGKIDETETAEIMALIDILNRLIDSGINTSKPYVYDPTKNNSPFSTDSTPKLIVNVGLAAPGRGR